MTFHTALRQLKPSLITAHLLEQRGILVMWFNKYFCIQRSTYLMSLTAQGNSRLPTKIKTPNLHYTHTHALTHTRTYTPVKKEKHTRPQRNTGRRKIVQTDTSEHNNTPGRTETHAHTPRSNSTTTCFSKRDKNK